LTVTNANLSGPGSLSAILAQATNGDTIRFSPSLANQTIPGSYTLNNNLTIDNTTAPASGLAIGGARSSSNVLTINSGSTVSISGLTITNSSGVLEGGILNQGTLNLSNCLLTGNTNTGQNGGGIDNEGTLTLTGCTVSGNLAVGGGGIFNGMAGVLTVTDSRISQNNANRSGPTGEGGGIFNAGQASVINSTVDGNIANTGGIENQGSLTLTNSTLVDNFATGNGGGIQDAGGTLALANCTIAGNTAGQGGGGLFFQNSFFQNGLVSLLNTIVATNTSPSGPDISFTVFISFTLADHNLIGDGTTSGLVNGSNGNQVGTAANPINPMLGPLQNNGGPTPTTALLPGSPAIDAGNNAGAPATDQRGAHRIVNNTIDIGAFEFQPPAVVLVASQVNPGLTGQPVTFQATLVLALQSNTPTGTVTFFDGGTSLGAPVPLNGLTATLATVFSTTGSHTITAVYSGDVLFTGSSSSPFNEAVNNPVPTILSLNPSSVAEGSSGFTLTVNGTSFVPTSTVLGNGVPLAVTFVNSTTLQAVIPPSFLVSEGQVLITVTSPGPGGGTSNGLVLVVVDAPLSGTGVPVNATTAVPFTAVVATFSDAGGPEQPGNYTAQINWGDGTSTIAVTVAASSSSPGLFTVAGSHTYSSEGQFTVIVTIKDTGGSTVRINALGTVADAPLHAQGQIIHAVVGQPFDQVVATFTDDDPLATATRFASMIIWGDGTAATAGVIAFDAPSHSFTVMGSHTYEAEGNFALMVQITDVGGSSAVATGTAITLLAVPLASDLAICQSGTSQVQAQVAGVNATLVQGPNEVCQGAVFVAAFNPVQVPQGGNGSSSEVQTIIPYDVRVAGAAPQSFLSAVFQFPVPVSGTPMLTFLDRATNTFVLVRGSAKIPGSFQLDLTQGAFRVVFDDTSNPTLGQFTGTLFTVSFSSMSNVVILPPTSSAPGAIPTAAAFPAAAEIPPFLMVQAVALTLESTSGGADGPIPDESEGLAWLLGMFRSLGQAKSQTSFIDTQPTMILSPSQESKVTPSSLEIGSGLGESLLPSEQGASPARTGSVGAPMPSSRPVRPPVTVPHTDVLPAVPSGLGDGQASLSSPPEPAGAFQSEIWWKRSLPRSSWAGGLWLGQLAAVLAGVGHWHPWARRLPRDSAMRRSTKRVGDV
jgi:hypothetical protein